MNVQKRTGKNKEAHLLDRSWMAQQQGSSDPTHTSTNLTRG